MTSKKFLPFLLLLALPACAQIEEALTPASQSAARPGAPAMTILTEKDMADMKAHETLPRPVNYDGQRWHYTTEAEQAAQDADREAGWKAQDPALRAAIEDKPVEWWGSETPSKPAPHLWWEARDAAPGERIQVYDDGNGGMTTTPPSAEIDATTGKANTAPQLKPGPAASTQPKVCPNGVCPAGQ